MVIVIYDCHIFLVQATNVGTFFKVMTKHGIGAAAAAATFKSKIIFNVWRGQFLPSPRPHQ
jgi:hypothetical protein